MKKLSVYMRAFIVLLIVFFTVGLCTLGSVSTAGEALFVKANKAVYFSLVDEKGVANAKKIDSVYVKMGSAYNEVGTNFTLSIGLSTTASASTSSSNWASANETKVTVTNVASQYSGKNGAQYNWFAVVTDFDEVMKSLSFSSSANLSLYEIVCFDTDGKQIFVKGYQPSGYTAYSLSEVTYACDAQDSFVKSESTYHNFTQEEISYMNAVQTLLSGKEVLSGNKYALDKNFNYLGTVLLSGSVAIFGESVFALRLPAFLATCVLLLCAFLWMKDAFKNEKYAFTGFILLVMGGFAMSLGRLGAPYAIVASALVASGYFMYRFFAYGISSKRVVKDGLNVLWSGLFAAVAMSIDLSAVFPVAAILVLFSYGLDRQKAAYKIALAKMEGVEEKTVSEVGEERTINRKAKELTLSYKEKNRICYGFIALSFVMATAMLCFLAAVISYSAAIKANGNVDPGFGNVLISGLKNSLIGDATVAVAGNASSAFAWFLPWKAATLYGGVNGGSGYLAWSVLPNVFLTSLALVALGFATVKVATGIARKTTDKKELRVRRIYFILLGGLATSMLSAACKVQVSLLQGYLFHVCYMAFLPLAIFSITGENEKTEKLADFLLGFVTGIALVGFIVSLPATYGFAVPEAYAKAFTWMSIKSNGFFR